MNIFDLLVGFYRPTTNGVRYGVADNTTNAPVNEDSLTVLFTCVKILADNFSRIPVRVKNKAGVIIDHAISDFWNIQPNNYTNPQTSASTSEWERNTHGNSFFEITRNGIIHIPAGEVRDWELNNGVLTYKIQPIGDPRRKRDNKERILNASKILHFRNQSNNGIFSLSPLSAAHSTHQLMNNAVRTVSSFYKNNAMSTKVRERTIPTGANYQQVIADRNEFNKNNAGIENAGGTITLPLGERITPLAVKFADAELIQTMVFSRDTIASLYQIPNWMLSNNDSTQNVEQQTSAFVSLTMANIANIYASELAFKILTKEEKKQGLHVDFDLDVLKEVTFADTIGALKEAVTNGLLTLTEARRKLKLTPVSGWGNKNLMQAQYIPVQDEGLGNPLSKDTPYT